MYSDVDGINGPETTGIILLNQGDDIPFIDAGLAFLE